MSELDISHDIQELKDKYACNASRASSHVHHHVHHHTTAPHTGTVHSKKAATPRRRNTAKAKASISVSVPHQRKIKGKSISQGSGSVAPTPNADAHSHATTVTKTGSGHVNKPGPKTDMQIEAAKNDAGDGLRKMVKHLSSMFAGSGKTHPLTHLEKVDNSKAYRSSFVSPDSANRSDRTYALQMRIVNRLRHRPHSEPMGNWDPLQGETTITRDISRELQEWCCAHFEQVGESGQASEPMDTDGLVVILLLERNDDGSIQVSLYGQLKDMDQWAVNRGLSRDKHSVSGNMEMLIFHHLERELSDTLAKLFASCHKIRASTVKVHGRKGITRAPILELVESATSMRQLSDSIRSNLIRLDTDDTAEAMLQTHSFLTAPQDSRGFFDNRYGTKFTFVRPLTWPVSEEQRQQFGSQWQLADTYGALVLQYNAKLSVVISLINLDNPRMNDAPSWKANVAIFNEAYYGDKGVRPTSIQILTDNKSLVSGLNGVTPTSPRAFAELKKVLESHVTQINTNNEAIRIRHKALAIQTLTVYAGQLYAGTEIDKTPRLQLIKQNYSNEVNAEKEAKQIIARATLNRERLDKEYNVLWPAAFEDFAKDHGIVDQAVKQELAEAIRNSAIQRAEEIRKREKLIGT